MSESDWLSEQDSFDLLKRMFPMGLRSDDLLTALCPEGWRSSSLKLLESSAATEEETEIDKIGYLVGLCLWDILSNNHDIIIPDARVVHLGSFRAAAGIISDFFSGESQE